MEIKPNNQVSFTFSEAEWIAISLRELPIELREQVQRARREFCRPYFSEGPRGEASSMPSSEGGTSGNAFQDMDMLFIPQAYYTDESGAERHVVHVSIDQPGLLALLEAAQTEHE